MTKCYQHDKYGFFVCETDDFGGFLPSGATYKKPNFQDGFIPRWTGEKWEQVENHKGKEGYLKGKPYIVKEYGPFPDGWSDEAPEPSLNESIKAQIETIKFKLTELDASKIRPASVIAQWAILPDAEKEESREGLEAEVTILAELNKKSIDLRAEMHILERELAEEVPEEPRADKEVDNVL